MKRQIATILLACYALALFRPIGSCFTDLLGHAFWHTEHVATVHFENGKYHLHVELREAGEDQESPSPSNTPQKGTGETAGTHIPNETVLLTPFFVSTPVSFTAESLPPPEVYLFVSSPPPWSC